MKNITINNRQKIIAVFPVIVFVLLIGLFSQASVAVTTVIVQEQWQNIEGISVVKSRRAYDRRNRQYFTYNTVTNDSGSDLEGPLRMVVTSTNHPVMNADGTNSDGQPYFDVLDHGDSLNDSQSLNKFKTTFKRIRASFAYTLVLQKIALDSDGDGIPDASDDCPFDASNDVDGDGICGSEDFCPLDASNACITINGQVNGAGAALQNATIKVGLNSQATLSEQDGQFSSNVGSADDFASDNVNTFFPVEVTANGYATGHGKIIFVPGTDNYEFFIDLEPVTATLTDEDDVTVGVTINKEDDQVGLLTIPTDSLPTGVTKVKGEITYLNPTTDDLQATPGGDLLALPENSNPNDSPVLLESFGMMEFNLLDQNGNEIHQLNGPAEVCMQATSGLTEGDAIPLWWFNKDNGLWEEEGQGTVVNKAGKLMLCGEVSHFTWWNYDRPVSQHACFKYHMVEDKNNPQQSSLASVLTWSSEAVTYSGISQQYATDRDSNDPVTPLQGNKINSLTVKRSVNTIEKNRIFTTIEGTRFYLNRSDEESYSLVANKSNGTIFNDPSTSASGIRNQNVENCKFLDYQDTNSDGIIEISVNDINLPPKISNFNALPETISEGATSNVSALVIDLNGDDFTVSWDVTCYGDTDEGSNDETISSSPTSSASTYSAIVTAPSSLNSPTKICKVSLVAEDDKGAKTSAERWITILADNFAIIVEGILYGTDGLPLTSHPISLNDLYYGRGCDDANSSTVTDSAGHYKFEYDGKSCSRINSDFEGEFSVDYEYTGAGASQTLSWNHKMNMGFSGNRSFGVLSEFDELVSIPVEGSDNPTGNGCSSESEIITCHCDIHLPVFWGPLSGNIYQPAENEKTEFTIRHGRYYNDGDVTTLNIEASATSYGPIYVPVGENYMDQWQSTYWGSSRQFYVTNTLGLVRDIGDVSGNIIATVFDDNGNVLAGSKTRISDSKGVRVEGVSDADGTFSAPSKAGYVEASAWTDSSTTHPDIYGNGYILTQGQQLYIDLNSSKTCSISVIVYDENAQPLENAQVSLYSRTSNERLN